MHKIPTYKWPPDYVGIPHLKLEDLLARERSRLEIEEQQNAARETEDCALANAISSITKDTEINVLKNNFKLKKFKRASKDKSSFELGNDKKIKKNKKVESKQETLKCRNCQFKVLRCFRSDLVRHQLKEHRNLYLVII